MELRGENNLQAVRQAALALSLVESGSKVCDMFLFKNIKLPKF